MVAKKRSSSTRFGVSRFSHLTSTALGSRKNLGKRIGVTASTIDNWVSLGSVPGKRAVRLASALNISLDELKEMVTINGPLRRVKKKSTKKSSSSRKKTTTRKTKKTARKDDSQTQTKKSDATDDVMPLLRALAKKRGPVSGNNVKQMIDKYLQIKDIDPVKAAIDGL